MIDLMALKQAQNLYEIKLESGEVIKILPPTQAMYLELSGLSNISDRDPIEQMKIIYGLCVKIFNNNTEKRNFSIDEIENMFDISIATYIVQDYLTETTKRLGK